MKLYQITEEYLEDYISIMKLQLGYEIVEHLAILRDDVEDKATKGFLQRKVLQFAEEYKVCRVCFEKLEPMVAKEKFDELDGSYCREYICGYECPSCEKKYNY